jgi:hypothetical protein
VLSIPLRQAGLERSGSWWRGALPEVTALAVIDQQAGAEIVVQEWGGAYTNFFAVFNASGGTIHRYAAPSLRWGGQTDGLFSHGVSAPVQY